MDIEFLLPMLIVLVFISAFIALCLPVYLGILTSLYLISKPDDISVLTIKFHVMQVCHSYVKLLEYWQTYDKSVSFEDFVVPLFLPPIVGALVGIFLVRQIILYCINRFRVT